MFLLLLLISAEFNIDRFKNTFCVPDPIFKTFTPEQLNVIKMYPSQKHTNNSVTCSWLLYLIQFMWKSL